MGGFSSFADRVRGLQQDVSPDFQPPEQYQQSPGFQPQSFGYNPRGGGYGAWPGQGYGGYPGRFQGGYMGGYNYGSPYGFGGGGFGYGGFSPWGYGPGSYSPWSSGSMGFGGGSGMMGGPMRPYSGFDYNQWTQQQVGDVQGQPAAAPDAYDPMDKVMSDMQKQIAKLQSQIKRQQTTRPTWYTRMQDDSSRGK